MLPPNCRRGFCMRPILHAVPRPIPMLKWVFGRDVSFSAAALRMMADGWFTPVRLLCLFCAINTLIALDRGVVPSNGVNGSRGTAESEGSGIQGDFDLSLFQDGLLPAAFQAGLLAASSLFAQASKRHAPFRLIGAGITLCTLAAAGCGLSLGFTSLLLSRAAMGVGQSAFIVLASPFINDHAPPDKKARWLAIFALCFPAGYALGYMLGGVAGSALGWRAVFLLEGAALAPFALFCLRAAPVGVRGAGAGPAGSSADEFGPQTASQGEEIELLSKQEGPKAASGPGAAGGGSPGRRQQNGGGGSGSGPGDAQGLEGGGGGWLGWLAAGCASLAADLRQLAAHPVYVLAIGGMVLHAAALSTLAYYSPKAGRAVFSATPQVVDVAFGAITVCTAIFGTLAGGVLLDRLGGGLRSALLLCALGAGAGGVLVMLGFAAAPSFGAFCVILALGEFAVFLTEGPGTAIAMWSVPVGLRPLAISTSVVACNLLGAVPGPPLMGLLQGQLDNWRLSMAGWNALLVAAGGLFAAAMLRARRGTDYNEVLLGAGASEAERGRGGRQGNGHLPPSPTGVGAAPLGGAGPAHGPGAAHGGVE